jgi:hypothetical protein
MTTGLFLYPFTLSLGLGEGGMCNYTCLSQFFNSDNSNNAICNKRMSVMFQQTGKCLIYRLNTIHQFCTLIVACYCLCKRLNIYLTGKKYWRLGGVWSDAKYVSVAISRILCLSFIRKMMIVSID